MRLNQSSVTFLFISLMLFDHKWWNLVIYHNCLYIGALPVLVMLGILTISYAAMILFNYKRKWPYNMCITHCEYHNRLVKPSEYPMFWMFTGYLLHHVRNVIRTLVILVIIRDLYAPDTSCLQFEILKTIWCPEMNHYLRFVDRWHYMFLQYVFCF